GGMGVVYEAVHDTLGRHVALKVLPGRAAVDPIKLLRFRREARAAARLHHTAIVPVYEVGEANGVHYYAMQFIRGQGLNDVLTEVGRLRNPAARRPVTAADTVADDKGDQLAPNAASAPDPSSGSVSSLLTGSGSGSLDARYYRRVARI